MKKMNIKHLMTLLLVFGLLVGPSSCACEGMHLECFNLDSDTLQPIDFNNISGHVCIDLKNIPSDTNKVCVYLYDDVNVVEIGRWVRGLNDEHQWFGFESDKFSNGPHAIRLISIKTDGGSEEQLINSDFNNLICNVSAGKEFHPSSDYYFSGIYDGGNALEVKLMDHNNQTLWPPPPNTYTYSGGSHAEFVIPGSAFGEEQLCKLLITDKVSGKIYQKKLYKRLMQSDFIEHEEPSPIPEFKKLD